MSTLRYFKIVRLILLIGLISAAWLTIQDKISCGYGWCIVITDAVALVMVDIEIKKYENDL
jgi:hypothetical protein